jgi:hypothetical protein
MRTAWKVLASILLGAVVVSCEAVAIAQVVRGHGAEVFFVNRFGVAMTWMMASINGAVGCVVIVIFIVVNAINRWRREHGY